MEGEMPRSVHLRITAMVVGTTNDYVVIDYEKGAIR